MGDSRGYDEWAQRIAARRLDRHTRSSIRRRCIRIFSASSTPSPDATCCSSASSRRSSGRRRACCSALAAARCSREGPALVAGLMLALYAPAIFFDGLLQKSVLDVFFVCLALWLIAKIASTAESADTRREQGRSAAQRVSAFNVVAVALPRPRDGRARADARERARLHRRHRSCGRLSARRAESPDASIAERLAKRAALFLPGSRSSLVPVAARNSLRRRRLLRHDVAVRAELLHRQQPARRRHVSVAALRTRRAGVRAAGRDRTGGARARADADAGGGVELLDRPGARLHHRRSPARG